MLALLWLLLVPCTVAGLVWVAATVYRRYKDAQLAPEGALDAILDGSDQTVGGFDDDCSDCIGDEWKGPVEVRREHFQIGDALVQFDKLIAEETKDVKRLNYWGTDRENDPAAYEKGEYEYALGYNRARDRMTDWMKGKRLTHPTGNQTYDFFAANPAKKIPEHNPAFANENVLQRYMRVNKLADITVVKALKEHYYKLTYPATSDLENTALAATIRKNAADKAVKEASLKMRQDFLEQLKVVQKNIEDDAFQAKIVLEEKLRLEKEVEGLRGHIEELRTAVVGTNNHALSELPSRNLTQLVRKARKGSKRVARASKRRKK